MQAEALGGVEDEEPDSVGVAEDGAMGFETVNPPLNAGAGFLSPGFAGRPVKECLGEPAFARFLPHLSRVLEEGLPLPFEEEHAVDGKTRAFQTILTPVRNKWGRIHRIAGISRDADPVPDILSVYFLQSSRHPASAKTELIRS